MFKNVVKFKKNIIFLYCYVYMELNKLFGTWKLVHNNNFQSFLKFVGCNWLIRKAAKHATIYIDIQGEGEYYSKKIRSSFYRTKEKIYLDNIFRKDKFMKRRYKRVGDSIICNVQTRSRHWMEKSYLHGEQIIIELSWNDDTNNTHMCTQKYNRI